MKRGSKEKRKKRISNKIIFGVVLIAALILVVLFYAFNETPVKRFKNEGELAAIKPPTPPPAKFLYVPEKVSPGIGGKNCKDTEEWWGQPDFSTPGTVTFEYNGGSMLFKDECFVAGTISEKILDESEKVQCIVHYKANDANAVTDHYCRANSDPDPSLRWTVWRETLDCTRTKWFPDAVHICENGKCVVSKNIPSCFDPDEWEGEDSKYRKTTVTVTAPGINREATDECCDYNKLAEVYCENNEIKFSVIFCNNLGMVCENGRCVNEIA